MSPWTRIAVVGETTADWASIFASLKEAVSKAGLEKKVLIWTCRNRPSDGKIDGHCIDQFIFPSDGELTAIAAIKRLVNGRK